MELYCCPRCGLVEDEDGSAGWAYVIVDDVTLLIDVVCPECVSPWDLTRPELASRLAEADAILEAVDLTRE